jgi:hypothetical protein
MLISKYNRGHQVTSKVDNKLIYDTEHQIISLDSYLEFLKQFESYQERGELLFRAQLAKYPTIIPSCEHNPKLSKQEEALVGENYGYINNPFKRLAMCQHNNKSTRLLDFTTNPRVALLFAVLESERCDSIIFMFIRQTESVNSLHAQVLTQLALSKATTLVDFTKEVNVKLGKSLSRNQIFDFISKPAFINRHTITDDNNIRMHNQSGTFAICS